MRPMDPVRLNGLEHWFQADGSTISYSYPGSIDVELVPGIRFQTKSASQLIELGIFRGGDNATAEMWMDESLWQWQKDAADRRARAWVKHVMVADQSGRPQAYEIDGELVLVGAILPQRQVESSLLQAGFRPSLATWRAKATDERRGRLPEYIEWLSGGHPDGEAPTATAESTDPKELQERAQHIWMRWNKLFEKELAIAGRIYQMRGRPTLSKREITIKFRHQSSGAELALRFAVAFHPLHHRTIAEFGDQTAERAALAWEEYPEFLNSIGDAIKPRSTAKKSATASPKSTAKPSAKSVATEAVPRSPLPPEKREEARTQIDDLVLPPPRRSAYLARVDRAVERGDSPKRLVTEAAKESKKFMTERAANRSQAPTWDEAVAQAFEQEPGWRLDVVSRGPGYMLTVYPDDGALGDATVSIDVRGTDIGEVHWLPGDLTPAQQDDLLRRVQRALKAAHAVTMGEPPPSPLQGRIEEVRRRAGELGIDPAVLAGHASHGVMAKAMAYLAEPSRDMPGEFIQWLRANYLEHPALAVIREWRYGGGPEDESSLPGELWSAVFKDPGTTPVHAREGGLQASCEAPFATHDGKQAVLLRRAGPGGEFQLFKMSALVRPSDDPNFCEIEDDAGELRDGDQLLFVGSEYRAEKQIELYRRIAGFIAEVERTPKRLEDVRQLLFLTAAMIDTTHCKGAHRAAAIRAFEKAREYYDTARRSLARGVAVAASERVHDALRRIGLAAASIAEACAEGQQPLGARVLSEHAPRVEPSAEDTETMRAVESAEKLAGPPKVTASVTHAHQALARAGVVANGAGLRTVGRLGEFCTNDASHRVLAHTALREAGIGASLVHGRLFFALRSA